MLTMRQKWALALRPTLAPPLLIYAFLLCCFASIDGFAADKNAAVETTRAAEKKLCLTMIVKNEAQIIERCLDSVKDIVDCVVVCDTGSTDRTVEIVEDYLQRNSIPGNVHRHTWENFGHNRSLSAKAAQETLIALGFSLPHTYLLLLDADMVLITTPAFDKQQLIKDEYLLVQKSPYLSYYNIRLIKASLPWKCLGVTHEYWSCTEKQSTEIFTPLWIDDRDDGGCKADKFERDVQLLTKGLKEDPSNIRYQFYLAQSYKSLERYDEAIKWYKERIAGKGWEEEVWYSMFMIGEIYHSTNEWDKALRWYLDAYQYNPKRSEPLERIALHYRLAEQHDLAHLFASQGAKIVYPTDQLLFISDHVYRYRFDEELSISSYYTPFREEGFAALERLQCGKGIPGNVKHLAEKNSRFYVSNLKNVQFTELPIEPPLIREGTNLRMHPMNPSILKTENGYHVICRCVNYQQEGAQNYSMIDPEDTSINIKTRNYLLKYDKDFNLRSQKEIIDNLSSAHRKHPYTPIEGLEDARIFSYDQALWATCTTQDMNNFHVPQIGLYRLADASSNRSEVLLDHFVPLKGPQPQRCEKNWLPFVKDGHIYAIYSYDPFVVFKVDHSTGRCEPVISREEKRDFSSFRGSAGPIPFDNGYLAVVHYVAYEDGRYYFHRFIYLDKDLNITHMSQPFTYKNQRVEYCCGMTLDHSGSRIIMSVGIEDRQAVLAYIEATEVRALLRPLD